MNKLKIFKKFLIVVLIIPVSLLLVWIAAVFIILFYETFINHEFGLVIDLYKAKECAYLNENTLGPCLVYSHATSTNFFNQKSLEDGLNYALNLNPYQAGNNAEEEKLKNLNLSRNPSDWICAKNGNIIEDKSLEKDWLLTGQVQYKCWPVKK
jgi:hypothetical protein